MVQNKELIILSKSQIEEIEKINFNSGIDRLTLIQRSGNAIANAIVNRFAKKTTYIICGNNKNSGRSIVAAQILSDIGWIVNVMIDKDQSKTNNYLKESLSAYTGRLLDFNVNVIDDEDILIVDDMVDNDILQEDIKKTHKSINYINNLDKPFIISIDVPSGVCQDSGRIDNIAAVEADITMVINYYKLGNLLYPGRKYCGENVFLDIGFFIPESYLKYYINSNSLWNIPKVDFDTNKYTRGYVYVYGGEVHFAGAASLVAHSALKSGSGIVKIVCHKSNLHLYRIISYLSVILGDEDDVIDKRCNSIVIGPGLDVSNDTKKKVLKVLDTKIPCVIDAGGISSFKENPEQLFDKIHSNVILTPHEGEFESLFGSISKSKFEKTIYAAKKSKAIILLKGPDTIIASPDGRVIVNSTSAYNLSFAGSGDVLSGIIGSFLSQKVEPIYAAAIAVYAHSLCASKIDQNIIADDIVNYISLILQDIQR